MRTDLKRLFAAVTTRHTRFTIFLDDLHVVTESLQPFLLGVLYSFARGNEVSLKVPALEHFTRHWDPKLRLGLEVPGDAQTISLDHNLTNPADALEHIRNILNSYARFCGLKSIQSVCGKDVIERLVWLAAGVPRDALSILQQAMASAAADGRKIVGITDVNIAASGYVEDENRYLGMDTSEGQERVKALLEWIKDFCIKQKKVNAFLVRLGNEEGAFADVLRLIDLRFLHVLNRGLTPGEAGEKYTALLLDYGFYTGVRRAKTMDVLQQKPGKLTYRELRKLPKFDPVAALTSGQSGTRLCKLKRKLIEVALPLEAINMASAREKSIRHGHPCTLHLWWARRPLAAARAVIFAQMVDDPSAHPDLFPTEKAQEKERQRLFGIIEELVQWENTTNEEVLAEGAGGDLAELAASVRRERRPSAGGGAVRPAQAARLPRPVRRRRGAPAGGAAAGAGSLRQRPEPGRGADQQGDDRDPAEVRRPAAGEPGGAAGQGAASQKTWNGAQGLAEDVRYYGQWMRDEAEKRIGHLYPRSRSRRRWRRSGRT